MKKVVIVFIILLLCPSSLAFTDVEESHWAYDTINRLSEEGFISGYPDGTFKPEDKMTIGEFSSILSKIIKLNVDVSCDSEHWSKGHITILEDEKIINKEEYVRISPEKAITRFEVCKMLVNSILKEEEELKENYISGFDDISINNREEQKIAYILKNLGILSGYPNNTVRFGSFSTRAEISSIISLFIRNRVDAQSMLKRENVVYQDGFAKVNLHEVTGNVLRKAEYAEDYEYATTIIKSIEMFEFNEKINNKYSELFERLYNEDNPYFQHKRKIGDGKYVIAIEFKTKNNVKNSIFAGYEFLHIGFPEEEIHVIDAFDTDEIERQINKNGDVGVKISYGETWDTSAFYVVDRIPERKILINRAITTLYDSEKKEYIDVSSFRYLMVEINDYTELGYEL